MKRRRSAANYAARLSERFSSIDGAIRSARGFLIALCFAALGLACSRREGEASEDHVRASARSPAASLMVYAAASLRDVLSEIARAYERSAGVRIVFNFAGSNVLAQQIAAAPGADLFVAANHDWVQKLALAGHVASDSERVVAANSLVVIAHEASGASLSRVEDLPASPFTHLAVGDPSSVPAGIYTRAYLSNVRRDTSDVWTQIKDRIAPASDVRAALAMVEADPKVWGVVYRTDALASKHVKVLFEVPVDATGAVVRYHAVLVSRSAQREAARRLLAFLGQEEAQAIFASHGFLRSSVLAATSPPKGDGAEAPR